MTTIETAVITAGTAAFFTALVAEQEARVAATKAALAAHAWYMPATTHAH